MALTLDEKLAMWQTVGTWVAALSVIFAFLTILNERVQRVRKRDTSRVAADRDKMGYFYVQRVSRRAALAGYGTQEPDLPTITGLIEAGDAGLWTSAALDQLQPHHREIGWVSLYRSIFNQAVEMMSKEKDGNYNPKVMTFLQRARRQMEYDQMRYEKKKQDWLAKDVALKAKKSRLGQGELAGLLAEQTELELERVFPLRNMLYHPQNSVVPTYTQGSHLLRMLSRTTAFVGGYGPQGQADAPAELGEISETSSHSILVNCARPLDLTPTPMFRHFSRSSNHVRNISTATSSDEPVLEIQPIVNHAQQSSQSTPGTPAANPTPSLASRFRHAVSSSSSLISPHSRRSTWEDMQQDDDPLRRADMGLNQIRTAWTLDGKPCIETSREELAALALILGMQLNVNEFSNTVSGIGAFGTSLYAAQAGGYWKLHLVHGSRIPKHLRSQGSGYTTLMAKYLACGNIPFADSSLWIASVYCTSDVVKAIKLGDHIQDKQMYGGPALEYLRRLPGEKQIDAYYGVSPRNPNLPFGTILKGNGIPVGAGFTWAKAVVGIAFGGLVPQAAPEVADAVRFTVGGYLNPDTGINALEGLIDELHRLGDNKVQMFGRYVAMRFDANQGIDNVNYTTPSRSHPRDSAAKFARYMNLLERVVARAAVVAGGSSSVNQVFEAACGVVEGTYQSTVLANGEVDYDDDLGRQIEEVKGRLGKNHPIPLDDCGKIVRCILAVWAEQVSHTVLEECRHSGARVVGGNCVATLEDLPAICALG